VPIVSAHFRSLLCCLTAYLLCMGSLDDSSQFRCCASEFSRQQGHAGQRAQMQELPINSAQASIQPAGDYSPECQNSHPGPRSRCQGFCCRRIHQSYFSIIVLLDRVDNTWQFLTQYKKAITSACMSIHSDRMSIPRISL